MHFHTLSMLASLKLFFLQHVVSTSAFTTLAAMVGIDARWWF